MPDDPIQQPARNASQSDAGGDENQNPEDKPEEIKTEEPTVEIPPAKTPVETPKEELKPEEKPSEEQKPEESKSQEPEVKIVEKEVIKEVPVEVIKEVIKEVEVEDPELSRRIADEKIREKLLENKKKADETRTQRRKDNLNKIVDLAKKKEINNLDVRDLLQVSQSTATDYLTELSKSGRLKSEKKARATAYKS